MEPTMGRIVFFTPTDPEDTSAVEAPAIVSRVNADGTLDLTVFPPQAAAYSVSDVAASDSGNSENGKWCWPPAAPTGSAPEGPTDAEEPEDKPEPEAPAAGGGDTSTGDGSGTSGEEPPTTSAASEKPLYAIAGPEVPAAFEAAGLETPDGATLYHYSSDTAGQAHTFDLTGVEGITLYAEADDNEQPVKPAGGVTTS